MLIKSLKMLNFRQFKGTTKVDFSCDQEKNVTIILGDNTYGKTTLLQAFNWCFYGFAQFDHNPNMLLNYEVGSDMANGDVQKVEVEITLLHEDLEYYVSRTQKYTCAGGKIVGEQAPRAKVSYKNSDGQTESVRGTEVDKVINNILPQDLSSYFFFDTERVNSISTRKDVSSAVKGLLGLSTLENAIKHLGSRQNKSTVIGKFYSNMDLDGDSRAQNALKMIQAAEERRTIIAEQLEECKSQIQHYESRKDQLDTILRENQTTANLQKKKEDIDKRIIEEKKALETTENAFVREFSRSSLPFFAQPLLETASSFLKEVKVDDKGVRDLTKPTIEELIKRGRCICGAEIIDGNDAYKHLMDELAYVPPESIGNTVRHYREHLQSVSRQSSGVFESLEERYQSIYRSKTRIQEWTDESDDISAQISGKENMARYASEFFDINGRLRDLNNKKESLIRDDATQKRDIEQYQKVYDGLVAVSGKNKEIMLLLQYADSIKTWLTDTYTEKEGSIRENLEEKVNSIFERMYHGQRRVVIDPKYQVSLLTTVAEKEIAAGESEGSNRVKNFAFIAGLVALAKEKILTDNSEDSFDLSSEPYPLVMDAPFSNADEIHTANISKVLPEVAEQVIMFVMHKDWRYAEPVMINRVGKQYRLEKISETHTELK